MALYRLSVVVSLFFTVASVTAQTRVIVRSGDQVPGVIGARSFWNFGSIRTGPAGVAFVGHFPGDELARSPAVYLATQDTLQLIAMQGEFAADFVDIRFDSPWPLGMDAAANVLFLSRLSGFDAGTGDPNCWLGNGTDRNSLVPKNQPSDVDGFFYENVGSCVVADDGLVAGRGQLLSESETRHAALWHYQDGQFETLAYASGGISGWSGEFLNFESVQALDNNQILFRAQTYLPAYPNLMNDEYGTLWRYHDGEFQLLGRSGQQTTSGLELFGFSSYAYNESGVAYISHSVDALTVAYTSFDQITTEVVSTGDDVPLREGTSILREITGDNFSEASTGLRMADDGAVLIHGVHINQERDYGGEALWIARPGEPLRYVAGYGDPVPGRPNDAIGYIDHGFNTFYEYAMDPDGTVAFLVPTEQSNWTLWISEPDAQAPKPVLFSGDDFVFADGSTRTIQQILFDAGHIDSPSNRRFTTADSEFPVHLLFTDGSSAIVAITVPEPNGVQGWFVLFVCILAADRRRKSSCV